jgi:hypothetical protein
MSSTRSRLQAETFQREEKHKQDAAAQQVKDAAKASVDARMKKFWSQDVDSLKPLLKSPAAIDKFHGLTRGDCTVDECNDALSQFLEQMEAEGTTLTEDGKLRLAFYAVVHHDMGLDLSTVPSWNRVLARLRELGAFEPIDAITVEKPAAPNPAQKLTLDELNLTTREGAAHGRRLVVEEIVASARPIYQEFKDFIYREYGRVISEAEADRSVEYVLRHNLNFEDRRTWDRVRVKVLGCLTREEQESQLMDDDANSMTSREFAKKYISTGGTLGFR